MYRVGFMNKDNQLRYYPVFLLDKDEIRDEETKVVFLAPFLNTVLELIPKFDIDIEAPSLEDFKQLNEDEILIGKKVYSLNDFRCDEIDPNVQEELEEAIGKKSLYETIYEMYGEEV